MRRELVVPSSIPARSCEPARAVFAYTPGAGGFDVRGQRSVSPALVRTAREAVDGALDVVERYVRAVAIRLGMTIADPQGPGRRLNLRAP